MSSASVNTSRAHTRARQISQRRQQTSQGGSKDGMELGRAAKTGQGSGTGVKMSLVGPQVFGSRTLEVHQHNVDRQRI